MTKQTDISIEKASSRFDFEKQEYTQTFQFKEFLVNVILKNNDIYRHFNLKNLLKNKLLLVESQCFSNLINCFSDFYSKKLVLFVTL